MLLLFSSASDGDEITNSSANAVVAIALAAELAMTGSLGGFDETMTTERREARDPGRNGEGGTLGLLLPPAWVPGGKELTCKLGETDAGAAGEEDVLNA